MNQVNIKEMIKQDTRKIKTLESIWEETGIKFTEDTLSGYVLGLLTPIYTETRKVTCFTIAYFIKLYGYEEAMRLALKWCNSFNCKVIYIAEGFNGVKDELWVVKNDNPIVFDYIPSRLSEKKEDHILRGQLLGYSTEVIDSYFIK